VILDPDPLLHIFPDIDRGLEWCEEQLLDAFAPRDGADDVRLYDRLCEQFSDRDVAALLMRYLEQQPVVEGGYLIRQGDQSTDMFFIESGRVAVQLDMGSRGSIRLRSMGAGTVVGEVALYLGIARSASVVAEVPSVVYRLTLDAMERMKAEHPALAATFHAFIVRITAGRLAANNKIIQALHLS
jgi:SulP family sulfate permease